MIDPLSVVFIIGISFSKYKNLDRFSNKINHLDGFKMVEFPKKSYLNKPQPTISLKAKSPP